MKFIDIHLLCNIMGVSVFIMSNEWHNQPVKETSCPVIKDICQLPSPSSPLLSISANDLSSSLHNGIT